MSRAIDVYNKATYLHDIYTGKISPLRTVNDLVVKPLVFNISKSVFGATEGDIKVGEDIFEGLYSTVNLDPMAALSNFKRAYEDYKYYSGKTEKKAET